MQQHDGAVVLQQLNLGTRFKLDESYRGWESRLLYATSESE
jgi:hypothetical protein